jgi:hypothetical protein
MGSAMSDWRGPAMTTKPEDPVICRYIELLAPGVRLLVIRGANVLHNPAVE